MLPPIDADGRFVMMKLLAVLAVLVVFGACSAESEGGRDIVVYGSLMCPLCTELKSDLDERGIRYTFVDLSTDRDAVNELSRALSRESWFSGTIEMPVVEVDGDFLSQPTVDRVLSVVTR